MLIGYSVRFNLPQSPSAAAAAWRTNAPPISRPENHVEAHSQALKNLAWIAWTVLCYGSLFEWHSLLCALIAFPAAKATQALSFYRSQNVLCLSQFLSHPKNLTAFSASLNSLCWHKNQFYWMQINFLSGTKCLWLAQYINKFLVRNKKFGPAQNILRPVKRQGNSTESMNRMSIKPSHFSFWKSWWSSLALSSVKSCLGLPIKFCAMAHTNLFYALYYRFSRSSKTIYRKYT